MPRTDNDLHLLKAAADFVADGEPPTVEEADEELTAAGIDPARLGRSLRQRLIQRTWSTIAKRNEEAVGRATRHRRARPLEMTRNILLPLIMKHPRRAETSLNFRNADEQTADDLWEALCDLEALDELD